MKLRRIEIKNYRSIESLYFDIEQLEDDSYTYGLIGVNEVGKSTILKAIALKDELKDEKGNLLPLLKDFKNPSIPIQISYTYIFDPSKIDSNQIIKTELSKINKHELYPEIIITYTFNASDPTKPVINYHLENFSPTIDEGREEEEVINELMELFKQNIHKTIFWTAEDRYLISQPISLSQFATDPESISIPLKNCFNLIGIIGQDKIAEKISLIETDSVEKELLEDELGNIVTEHINNAWPKHKIKITFSISSGLLNFHVHDSDSKEKAKTADQRSDGFKQFISFLLTISAQSKNNQLINSILLLDEPETHLHPQAQEDLLKELIKITKSNNNCIVFFATHSNYMIDKNDLSRNYKIEKNSTTSKEQFNQQNSTYSSVTYGVFGIANNDYHNELYSTLHNRYIEEDESDSSRSVIKNFDQKFFHETKHLLKDKPWKGISKSATLPTHIRNCIDHPGVTMKFSYEELEESIKKMISYL